MAVAARFLHGFVWTVLCALVLASGAHALNLPVTSTVDATYTLAQSPITVTASSTIAAGVTVTFMPGVQVLLSPGVALQVDGTLIAIGTSSQKIAFTSSVANPTQASDHWAYISFTSQSQLATVDGNGDYVSGASLQHVDFSYGGGGTAAAMVRVQGGGPFVRFATFRRSRTHGLMLNVNSFLNIADSYFLNNAQDGLISDTSIFNVARCRFANNGGAGASLSAMGGTVSDSVFTGNSVKGLYSYSGCCLLGVVRNCTFNANGLGLDSSGNIKVSKSRFTNNVNGALNMLDHFGAGQHNIMEVAESFISGNGGSNAIWLASNQNGATRCNFTGNVVTGNSFTTSLLTLSGSTEEDVVSSNDFRGNSFTGSATNKYAFIIYGRGVFEHNLLGVTTGATYTVDIEAAQGVFVSLKNNWWGTSAASTVLSCIRDFRTDSSKAIGIASPYLMSASFAASTATIPSTLTGLVDSDTTWTVAGSPYTLTTSLVVLSGVTLTIDPGVVVKFGSGLSLQVNGQLVAMGTSAQPIRFTSSSGSPTAGSWARVVFTATSPSATLNADGSYQSGSILTYCNFEYGGGNSAGAMLYLNSRPYMSHNNFKASASCGARFEFNNNDPFLRYYVLDSTFNGAHLCSGASADIRRSFFTGSAVGADLDYTDGTIEDSVFTGNSQKGLRTYSGCCALAVVRNVTLSNNGLGLDSFGNIKLLNSRITGNTNGALNMIDHMGAGQHNVMQIAGCRISGNGGSNAIWLASNQNGATRCNFTGNIVTGNTVTTSLLTLSGSTEEDVVNYNDFRGNSFTGSATNKYAFIIYGRGVFEHNLLGVTTGATYTVDIEAAQGVFVSLKNNWWGTSAAATVLSYIRDFRTDSSKAIGIASPYLMSASFAASTATIPSTLTGLVDSDTTWTVGGSPYTLTTSLVVLSGVTLTIDPGVVVKFGSGLSLQVNGQLVAMGTSAQPIRFTSSSGSPTAGSWARVVFTATSPSATLNADGSYQSGSILTYCNFEYGGGNSAGAMLYLNSRPYMSHNNFKASASCGARFEFNNNDPFLRYYVLDSTFNGAHLCSGASADIRRSFFTGSAVGADLDYTDGTIEDSVFTGNSQKGLRTYSGCCALAVVRNVTLSNNGLGLDSFGNIKLLNSRITGNTNGALNMIDHFGAGQHNVMHVENCVISNNQGANVLWISSNQQGSTVLNFTSNLVTHNQATDSLITVSASTTADTLHRNVFAYNSVAGCKKPALLVYGPLSTDTNVFNNPRARYQFMTNTGSGTTIVMRRNFFGPQVQLTEQASATIVDYYDENQKAVIDFEPFLRFAPAGCGARCAAESASPQAVQARFADSGASLTLRFDQDTDQAGIVGQDSCAGIFAPATLSQLGAGALCSWQDASTLIVTFGQNPSLMPDDSLVIKSGSALHDATGATPAAAGSVAVCGPDSPLVPVAVLTAPADTLNTCEDLILDASASFGSGGRPLKHAWTFDGVMQGNARESDPVVTIAASNVPSGRSVTYSLRVTNFFGQQSPSVSVDVAKVQLPTPAVAIAGPEEREVLAAQPADFAAEALVPACLDTSVPEQSMEFRWSLFKGAQQNTPVPLPGVDTGARTLSLHPFTLTAGVVHALRVEAWFVAAPDRMAAVEIALSPVLSPLRAVISGGSRAHKKSDALVLDARGSQDPDGTADAWNYRWRAFSGDGQGSAGGSDAKPYSGAAFNPAASSITLPGNSFLVPVITFELTVSKGLRAATAVATIVLMPDTVRVRINSSTADPAVVPVSQRLVLQAFVQGGAYAAPQFADRLAYRWAVVRGDLDLEDPLAVATGSSRPTLVVLPGGLVAGQTVTLRCFVNVTGGGAGQAVGGFGEITFDAVLPPLGGSLVSSASYGVSTSPFTLTAKNWAVDPKAAPATYLFFYQFPMDPVGLRYPLGLASEAAAITAHLPSGCDTIATCTNAAARLLVGVAIRDRAGSVTEAWVNVTVATPASSPDLGDPKYQDNAWIANEVGRQDVGKVLQRMQALIDLIDMDDNHNPSESAYLREQLVEVIVNLVDLVPGFKTNAVKVSSRSATDAALLFSHALQLLSRNFAELTPASRQRISELLHVIGDSMAGEHSTPVDGSKRPPGQYQDAGAVVQATASTQGNVLGSVSIETEPRDGQPGAGTAGYDALMAADAFVDGAERALRGYSACGEDAREIDGGTMAVVTQTLPGREVGNSSLGIGQGRGNSNGIGEGEGGGRGHAKFDLPRGLGPRFNRTCLHARMASFEHVPFIPFAGQSSTAVPDASTLVAISPAVQLSFSDSAGQEVPVQGLPAKQCINVTLPINRPPKANDASIKCAWLDEKTKEWKENGCTLTERRAKEIVCCCTHLTTFAALSAKGGLDPLPPVIDPVEPTPTSSTGGGSGPGDTSTGAGPGPNPDDSTGGEFSAAPLAAAPVPVLLALASAAALSIALLL